MSWFNDLTEEDKKKIVSDEVFLVRREPVGTEHFPDDPKSPENESTNVKAQTIVESKEPGEIGEDRNELVDLQGKPMAGKNTTIEMVFDKKNLYWENPRPIGNYLLLLLLLLLLLHLVHQAGTL